MKLLSAVLFSGLLLAQQRPVSIPESTGANLPAQAIGRGDLLGVSVYGSPELTRTVRVGQDGEIRLPMLKQHIKADGFLPADLETSIAEALKSEGLIVDPFVTVTIAEYQSRPINVMGAVKRPTTFQAIGKDTLLDALARAEGLSPDAGQEILVTRQQPGLDGKPASLTQRIMVKTLIDAADPDANLTLLGGEEVRVPEAGKIFVVGNVKKPGAFSVPASEQATVLQYLALAEGLMPYATKEAYIYRREQGTTTKNEIPIPLRSIMDRKAPDVPLLANDILYIPDDRGRRVAMSTIDRIITFGAGTVSGVLVYRTLR